jgi:hypothetical protein
MASKDFAAGGAKLLVLQVDETEYNLVTCVLVLSGSEHLGREGAQDQATSTVPLSALLRTYIKQGVERL